MWLSAITHTYITNQYACEHTVTMPHTGQRTGKTGGRGMRRPLVVGWQCHNMRGMGSMPNARVPGDTGTATPRRRCAGLRSVTSNAFCGARGVAVRLVIGCVGCAEVSAAMCEDSGMCDWCGTPPVKGHICVLRGHDLVASGACRRHEFA